MPGDRENKMILGAFMQAANCSNYAASWRHPETVSDFLSLEYFQRIAEILEQGKFHFAFIDDRLAMPGTLNNSIADTVSHGIRAVKYDLVPIVMGMAMSTTHLGIGATYSTTYHHPFHIARLFATLDHMTNGRVGWNVVTSLNDEEAKNFGFKSHLDHDERYDQADEIMEVVTGLWDTWQDGAVLVDKDKGLFANQEKVNPLNYNGKYVSSKGPLTVPRSPQGHPVIMQAGQSEKGKEFAAKWGEIIFAVFKSKEEGEIITKDIKSRAEKYGRDPEKIKVVTAAYTIPAETMKAAEDKKVFLENIAKPEDKLTLLSEILNFDLGSLPEDHIITEQDLRNMSGARFSIENLIRQGKEFTLGDLIEFSDRGTIHELPIFCGTPNKIADEMSSWYNRGSCDGFMIAATHIPGSYSEFTELVVPELQKMGTIRNEFNGLTLREALGFDRP